jgi:hypothetical protein
MLIPRALREHPPMLIRHNPAALEKPFFRRGGCVRKRAHHMGEQAKA